MSWSQETLNAIWRHQFQNKKWGNDECTAWIHKDAYGEQGAYGWDVDHIDPNGGNYLSNLQPMHWRNNRAKGDSRGRNWKCAVMAGKDAGGNARNISTKTKRFL